MFLNVCKHTFHISHVRISPKSKRCFNVKSSTYYFHMKDTILSDFQICISLPLNQKNCRKSRCLLTISIWWNSCFISAAISIFWCEIELIYRRSKYVNMVRSPDYKTSLVDGSFGLCAEPPNTVLAFVVSLIMCGIG